MAMFSAPASLPPLPSYVSAMLPIAGPPPPPSAHSWDSAFSLWLSSRLSPNTRRAYQKAWDLFLAFANKPPSSIGRLDISAWIDSLRLQSLAPETIRQRLAALSSFYTFTMKTYTTLTPDGREHPLHTFNPANTVPHPKTSPYGKSRYLTPDEARAFLQSIPRHTLQGLRDYALFLAYLATGRRNSEIRLLRFGDLEFHPPLQERSEWGGAGGGVNPPLQQRTSAGEGRGGVIYYRWSGKGKSRRDELPRLAWQAIQRYLISAGRFSTLQPSDYLFTPLNQNASRFPQKSLCALSAPGGSNPLSSRSVDRLVKKYARLAALDPSRITVHTLRHTAAMLRKEAGDDLASISSFLGHSNLSITQIYLHQVSDRPDTTWLKVADLLGLSTPNDSPSLPGKGKLSRAEPGVRSLRRPLPPQPSNLQTFQPSTSWLLPGNV